MRLREEIRRLPSPDSRGMRDNRRKKREILRRQLWQVKRIKKLRRSIIHPEEKGEFTQFKFKINGMTRDEARSYQTALAEFIADEKSRQETSDDFSESEEELPGGKVKTVRSCKSANHGREAATVRKVSVNCRTIQNQRKPIKEGMPVERNRRVEKFSKKVTAEKNIVAEIDPEVQKFPIKECRVLLRRLSSEIAEGLISRPRIFGNLKKRQSSDKSQSSPAKSVSAGGTETNEEDNCLLDEETVSNIFSGNSTLNPSIQIYSPRYPTLTDVDETSGDSSSPPVLPIVLPSPGCSENSRSPPRLSAVGRELREDKSSLRRNDESMELVDYHGSLQSQQRFSDMVSALGKTHGYLNVVCVDWNHSAKPSEVKAEKLSICQLEMLVTSLATSLERYQHTTSILCEEDMYVPNSVRQIPDSNCHIPWQSKIHPSFQQQEINVALQFTTRNVKCVSGDYSMQQAILEEKEDLLKIKLQLKQNS